MGGGGGGGGGRGGEKERKKEKELSTELGPTDERTQRLVMCKFGLTCEPLSRNLTGDRLQSFPQVVAQETSFS